jgi:hypothetical protein
MQSALEPDSTLGVCPHCRARIQPLRVLRITRATPYKCPSCEGTAVILPRSGMTTVLAYVVALAIPLFALDYLGVSRLALFAACAAAAVAMPLVFARFCRFEPSFGDANGVKELP